MRLKKYSGLIYGHILLIAGSTLDAFNLTSWYREIMAEIRGQSTKKKTRWIDGLALLSGLLLMAGGACSIVHWIIDYRFVRHGMGLSEFVKHIRRISRSNFLAPNGY